MDLKRIKWDGLGWIQLTENRHQWWAIVNMVMNLWVPLKAGNFSTS